MRLAEPAHAETVPLRLFRIATARHWEAAEVVVPKELAPIERSLLFPESCPHRLLELGAGWGEFVVEWLRLHPDHWGLAFEVKGDRIRSILRRAAREGVDRLRIVPINFKWFLTEILPPAAFDLIVVNFPDPWPKRRHWKHRLVDGQFPAKAAGLLRPHGRVALATDYSPYARRMLGHFRASGLFTSTLPPPHYARTRPEFLPPSKFERIHLTAGRIPYYQIWSMNDGP